MSQLAREVQLVRRPVGALQRGDFTLAERRLPALERGQFLVKNRYLSIDPVRRVFFANGTAPLGAGLHSYAIGEVVASQHPRFEVGELVGHYAGLRDYGISDGEDVRRISLAGEPLHWHMGPLGIGGFFAWVGLLEIARARPGETVFVSTAAGSVGSVASQLARIMGCCVIGSTGSEEKAAWLRDVAKLPHVINYKRQNLRDALGELAPEGIDVYFDNVGGSQLDDALAHIRPRGRVAICGMVSAYDQSDGFAHAGGAWTWRMMTSKVTLRSFDARDHQVLWPQFLAGVRGWLHDGSLVSETQIAKGLERVPESFVDLLAGNNLGKMLVEV